MQKTEIPEDKNIKLISMHDEMSSSYLSYAMSVIVSRALPDIRDGLKPVHRRILYAMYKGGYDWSKQFRKSARIVGDVIGKYHPHGDQSVYDALVRMVQDFSMSLPLVDGQGNFGSIDGDPAAAMRYTETRLSKVSQYLIDDIEKNTISFKNNYDETEKEPTVLPAQFPNLLVNGAGGIAVGMATSIPPHNLGEIINGTLALIENKDIKIKDLMKHIPGPDFPTGGVIIGKDMIKQGYNKGRGSFKIRGEISIESLKNGRERLVITSIPYQVNKSVLNERIAQLVREKKIEGIRDIRDESNREGIRVSIDLRSGVEPETVKRQLYKNTQIESKIEDVIKFIKKEIQLGNQIFWVCPLIEESKKIDHSSAIKKSEYLKKIFPNEVYLLHGKTTIEEKEEILNKFLRNEFKILVSTTIIEVGIDFPNANVIIIENANKFGLSQLHQLRGRVGRGNKESSCVLMFKSNLSENAKKRINILKDSNDGFKISEEDMKLRGFGDILGFKQSGIKNFKLADPIHNHNLFILAEKEVKRIENEKEDIGRFKPLIKLYDRADIINDIA